MRHRSARLGTGVVLSVLMVAALAAQGSGSCFPPPAGIIGWWPGDGNAGDVQGANNGTLRGGATADAVGAVGQAFSLDGTNGFVQIPDSPALRPANLTVEAWVLFSSLDSAGSGNSPAGQQFIVFKQNTRKTGFAGFYLGKERRASGDVLVFAVNSSSGKAAQVESSPMVATGVWYHVAGVRGADFLQLYINGQLVSQASVSFAQTYDTLPLYFGTSGQSWDHKLKGSLDEVSLYNRALSASEIAAIYAAGAAGKCKPGSGVTITTQPQSQTLAAGSDASFTVAASGAPPLAYQWQFNGTDLSGATGTNLTLTAVQLADAGSYTAVVTNSTSSATSSVAVLTVALGPLITSQPASQSVPAGTNVTLSVSATGLTPLGYQWLFSDAAFSGATNASLTLTAVQPGNAGSYSVVVTNSAGAATSAVAVLTVVPAPGTLVISGAQTYQVIDGFGVNANHRSWTNSELQPVLDALIDQAGMTLFHVIFDNNNWEATNDNIDANLMDWPYYTNVYSAPEFQKLWGIMGYLNQRGITNGLVPEFEGPVALWMGGLSLTPGYENEYAETIASALVYARTTQHLQFSVVGPVNEPDITYTGIHMTGATQYVTVMHDLAQQLDNNGLSDLQFSGPDLANTSTAWLGTMMADPVVMAKLARFGLHSYLGETRDASGVYRFIQQSAYPDRHFWMTEFNVWCQGCLNGVSGDNSWAYARGTASFLLNLLAEGASAGIVWEGYDSQYVDFNPTTGGNNPPHWTFWGLLAVDDTNANVKTYTPRKGFYALAQIAKFVRPGAQRIDVSGSTPLNSLAFYNTNGGQFTLTGVNTNSSAFNLSCALTSLPPIPSVDLFYTSSTTNLCHGTNVALTNGAFNVLVPADCVFTLSYTNPPAESETAGVTNPPTMGYAFFGQGRFQLAVTGLPKQLCALEVSSDLVHWFDLTNLTLQDGAVWIVPPMTEDRQFYRARLLP